MIRVLVLLLVVAASATACGSEVRSDGRGLATQTASATDCGEPGSMTDLSLEPAYSANYLHRWTTLAGCEVRLDVIMTRSGADSCGGSRVADILMGWPLGTSHQKPSQLRDYVRDPHNVMGDPSTSAAFDANAELPDDAVDTGYRQNATELWMLPGDDAFLYLVDADGVERWPHDAQPTGCL